MYSANQNMEQETTFTSCKTLPTQNDFYARHDQLLNDFKTDYTLIRFLGAGSFGFVFELQDQMKHSVAIKMVPYLNKITMRSTAQRRELEIMCKLNDLVDTCFIFPRVYGWMTVSALPEEWKDYFEELYEYQELGFIPYGYRRLPLLLMCTEKVQYTLQDNILISENDLKCILFLLLNGLMHAKKKLKYFAHEDLHNGNIMLTPANRNNIYRIYDENDERVLYELSGFDFIPKIIDYGFAEVEEKTPGPKAVHNDLEALRVIFIDVYESYGLAEPAFFTSEQYRKAAEEYRETHQPMIELLEDPYFNIKNIQKIVQGTESSSKRIKIKSCIKCSETIPKQTKYFCKSSCEDFCGVLKKYLPK